MTVLIVDDQTSVVDGIASGVNWRKLGINRIFTAYNAVEAREIFSTRIIDILLCDIEMPAENGLSLLYWIREQSLEVECIFLTAHAEFSYAKEALRLGSFDYIIQPARYSDIEVALHRAIEKIQNLREQQKYIDYGRLWWDRKDIFWGGILEEWICGETESINSVLQDFQKLSISITEKSEFFVVIFNVMRWNLHKEEWDEHTLYYAFSNILLELLEIYGQRLLLIPIPKQTYALLIYSEEQLIDQEGLQRQLNRFIVYCKEYLQLDIACYTGNPVLMPDVSNKSKKLLALRDDNVAYISRLFWESDKSKMEQERLYQFNSNYITDLLLSGYYEAAETELTRYLEEFQKRGVLDAEILQLFYQDFMRTVFSILDRMDLQTHDMFKDKVMKFTLTAYQSIDDMLKFIHNTLNYLHEYVTPENDSKSQIQRIVYYIQNHLEKDIRRSDLAKEVFLNEDYLSRLFKKEMGISLKNYILNEKMKVAQTLLQTTALPISDIATRVGYTNFSHFSQSYKKVMGITPMEERQQL
ncbi:response regulator transcription factor [Massiliimalia massiliensis]|uniref:response regulator transcription factor n=1 Tax=Massiliimalia massiliensis TaxID=1852384 RepID=UPI000985D68B|nr:response regulator [Massiliimalia massiliensis]